MRILTRERYENAIYMGRTRDVDDNSYYYVGQAKDPGRRWDQHLRRRTGPCQFGCHIEWAVLVWGVPDERLDSAESYLIGYVLSRLGCVNGNRGKDEKAFAQGYRDAAADKPPAICPDIDISSLDWQDFYPGSPDVIVDNRISPSDDTDIGKRFWGFHTLDADKAVQPYVKDERHRLDQLVREQRDLRNKLQDTVSLRNALWFVAGLAVGILFMYLWFTRV
jgi:hypothetical protein